MADFLKTLNGFLFIGIILFGILALGIVVLVGAVAISQAILPLLWLAGGLALLFLVLVVLPLSILRRFRAFTAASSLVVSYIFGAALWTQSLLLTLVVWGPAAVVFGIVIGGIGIVPIAIVAMLIQGAWKAVGELFFLILLTYGSRSFAFWIGDRADNRPEAIATKSHTLVYSAANEQNFIGDGRERQEMEELIQKINEETWSRYTDKQKEILARHRRRTGKPACGECGTTFNLDEIYVCMECEIYYCYRCVWKLEKVEGAEVGRPPNRWRCACGGELW